MLRLLILTAIVCGACDESGTWPGGSGSGGGGSGGGGGGGGGGDENILVNGGFEEVDGAFAASWRNVDDNPDGAIGLVDAPVHRGAHALEWQIDAAGDGREYFVIQDGIDPALLEPGVRYEMSGWYRSSEVDGDISFNYIVRGDDGGEVNIGNDWDNTHPSQTDTWERFAWQFTVPDSADPSNYSVYLHLIKWTAAPLRLEVDDVTLLPAM